jgi:hypothetical protein
MECNNFFEGNGIAYHSSFLVMNNLHNKIDRCDGPYFIEKKLINTLFSPHRKRFQEEGIYIFGGKLGDQTMTSDLWIIKLGSEPWECSILPTSGKPP